MYWLVSDGDIIGLSLGVDDREYTVEGSRGRMWRVSFIAETTVDGRDIICRVLLVCGLEVIASLLGIGGRISFIAGAANIVVFEEADWGNIKFEPVGAGLSITFETFLTLESDVEGSETRSIGVVASLISTLLTII